MTMVELLEKDREELLKELANTPGPEQAEEILEKELDRILYRYNESEKKEAGTLAASDMMQVCRLALPLVDSIGENIVWTAAEDGGKKKNALILPICLLAGGALAFLMLAAGIGAGEGMSAVYKIMAAAGFLLFLAGGFLLGKNMSPKAETGKSGRRVENRVDEKRVMRTFRGMLQGVDQNIGRAVSREESGHAVTYSGDFKDGELALFSGLLEAMYSGDGSVALDRLEDIRYFLHCNGIETVDFEEKNRGWFDVMPSMTSATLRPALISDGKLLRKGLAAGG